MSWRLALLRLKKLLLLSVMFTPLVLLLVRWIIHSFYRHQQGGVKHWTERRTRSYPCSLKINHYFSKAWHLNVLGRRLFDVVILVVWLNKSLFWKQKIKQGRDIINSCYDPLRNTCKGGTNPLSTKITNVYELGKRGIFFALKTFFW